MRFLLVAALPMKIPVLRLVSGLILVLSVVAAGAMARSAWLILPLAVIYTTVFILGRWKSWRLSIKSDPLSRVLANVFSTGAVQAILVTVLYLIGRGAASVFGNTANAVLSSWDIFYCMSIAIAGISLGSIVAWKERGESVNSNLDTYGDDMNTPTSAAQRHEIRLLPESINLDNFFHSIHYSHGTYEGPERIYVSIPNENSAGSDTKITAVEKRLAIQLPEKLKALYRVQNGGSIDSLCTVKHDVTEAHWYEDLVLPFGGYDDLLPTELLRSMFDSASDYADPNDESQAESFPEGCKKMIILAQWYRHTLFLDYNGSGAPKVGFVDFDHSAQWQTHCVWWDSFETFFSALRRYETL
jgi:SMI1 / KNR4 family (SUKH-1)